MMLMDGNWDISADLSGCEHLFPIPIPKKPDIVVWCTARKIVHLIELTVPHEDKIEAMSIRMNGRYEPLLVEECGEAGWKATHYFVEVGCSGLWAQGYDYGYIKLASTVASAVQP